MRQTAYIRHAALKVGSHQLPHRSLVSAPSRVDAVQIITYVPALQHEGVEWRAARPRVATAKPRSPAPRAKGCEQRT